jgi:uncharacterized protein (TIGR02145 family)
MRKIELIFGAILLATMILYSCGDSNSNEVTVGTQVWMPQNLNTDTFQNGDKINQVKSLQDWNKAILNEQPACCYYEFNDAYEKKYGKIYNFYAVIDPRKLAPIGWRIPNNKDWKMLTINLDPSMDTTKLYLDESFELRPTKASTKLKSVEWNGTNESKFNALPGGLIVYEEGDGGAGADIFGLNFMSAWWSIDSKDFLRSSEFIIRNEEKCYFGDMNWQGGCYVRCVK